MDERPEELRRQRELIAAHLRWLDRQIAGSSGAKTSDSAEADPATEVSPVEPKPVEESETNPAASEEEQLAAFAMPEVDPNSIRNEVKRGCVIYVVAVSALRAAELCLAMHTRL